jgi:hypothetical protein
VFLAEGKRGINKMDYREYQNLETYKNIKGALNKSADKEGQLPSEFRKGLMKLNITAADAVELLNLGADNMSPDYMGLINTLVMNKTKACPNSLAYRKSFVEEYLNLLDEYMKARTTSTDGPTEQGGYLQNIFALAHYYTPEPQTR